jgi:hypothetical protein
MITLSSSHPRSMGVVGCSLSQRLDLLFSMMKPIYVLSYEQSSELRHKVQVTSAEDTDHASLFHRNDLGRTSCSTRMCRSQQECSLRNWQLDSSVASRKPKSMSWM